MKRPKIFNPEEETLSPRDVAKLVEWKEVLKSLRYNYPGFKWTSYDVVYDQIKNARGIKRKDPDERLEVYATDCYTAYYPDDHPFNDRGYYGIHTIDKDGKEWGISFRKWNQTMTMPFSTVTLKHYTFADMLAHYIYELTWYGPEKVMLEKAKEIDREVKKIEKELRKEDE